MGHYLRESVETFKEFPTEIRNRTVPAIGRGIGRIASASLAIVEKGLEAWIGPVPEDIYDPAARARNEKISSIDQEGQ